MRHLSVWTSLFLLFFLAPAVSRAQEQTKVEEFRDGEYGYAFKYPAGWELLKLPEREGKKDVRVKIDGPDKSSFVVIIERGGKAPSKSEFESIAERETRVQDMMRQTTDQIYRTISRNIGAEEMKLGEQQNLSNSTGVKFYISTLNVMKAGKPIIVAGIHAYPFSKDYSINFIMTAFLDREAKNKNDILTAVFNSFHVVGESPRSDAKER